MKILALVYVLTCVMFVFDNQGKCDKICDMHKSDTWNKKGVVNLKHRTSSRQQSIHNIGINLVNKLPYIIKTAKDEANFQSSSEQDHLYNFKCDSEQSTIRNHTLYYSGNNVPGHRNGVGISVNQKIKTAVKSFTHINDRILLLKLNATPINRNIIQILLPLIRKMLLSKSFTISWRL